MNLTERYLINRRSEIWFRKRNLSLRIRTDSIDLGMSYNGLSLYYGIIPGTINELVAMKIDDEKLIYQYENIIFGE